MASMAGFRSAKTSSRFESSLVELVGQPLLGQPRDGELAAGGLLLRRVGVVELRLQARGDGVRLLQQRGLVGGQVADVEAGVSPLSVIGATLR